jgi:hypothetical protein
MRKAAARLVVASLVTAGAVVGPACLPDIQFETVTDGGEGGGAGADAADVSSPPASDGAFDGDAGSLSDTGAPEPEAAPPSSVGPFANGQFSDYAQSARCAVY